MQADSLAAEPPGKPMASRENKTEIGVTVGHVKDLCFDLTGIVRSSVHPESSLWLKSPAQLSIPIIVTSPGFPLPLQTQRYKWVKNMWVLAVCPAGEGTQTKILDLWILPSQVWVQVLRSRQAVTANPSPWFEQYFKDISMTTTNFLGWRS